MNFCIITANHKRPKVFALWCESMSRLREEVGHFPIVVVSDLCDAGMCKEHNIYHIVMGNRPVSAKFNKACRFSQTLGVDYVMTVGSDDIISTETMKLFLSSMDKGYDMITLDDIYFYGAYAEYNGVLVHFKGKKELGLCRTVHKSILDKIGWMPWRKQRSSGLDMLARMAYEPHIRNPYNINNAKVFDVKTEFNINRFSYWLRTCERVDANIFYNILSEREKELLNNI